jgi:hypothetical protein
MNIQPLQERYEEMDWKLQLGNLASTLARISTRVPSPEHDALVVNLLQEAALFIEWSAPHVPKAFLLELASLQKELLAWGQVWPLAPARALLSLYARNRSNRLLQMAGLVGE